MFGLEYKTLLKRDIVEILDIANEPLSAEAIQVKLGYSNAVTVQETCNDLVSHANNAYTSKSYYLHFHNKKRGAISLDRYSTNLQSLYTIIFSADIAFTILFELIQKRDFSSIDFCLNHNISKSTLQRKIRQINLDLRPYKIHISCSDKVRFKASELDIRFFSYFFLWNTHRGFSTVDWNLDVSYFTNTAASILKTLGIKDDPTKVESLAFSVYVYWNAQAKKKKLSLSAKQKETFSYFDFPDRCMPFLSWDIHEWQIFLISLYISDLYDFSLDTNQRIAEGEFEISLLDCQLFQYSLCKHFGGLSSKKKIFIQDAWMKHLLATVYFYPSNKMIADINHIVSFESLTEEHPFYCEKFEHLWVEFLDKCSDSNTYLPMKNSALLICINLFPITTYTEKISLFVVSDLGQLFTDYLKERIKSHYAKKYKIDFVNNMEESTLIISTTPIDKQQLNKKQSSITITAHLREKDFQSLDIALFHQQYPNPE